MGDDCGRRHVGCLLVPCVACMALTTIAELFEAYCASDAIPERDRALLKNVLKSAFYAGAAAMLDALDLDTRHDPDYQRLADEVQAEAK